MAILPILAAAAGVGKILGGIGKGRAEGREAEADLNYKRDNQALDAYSLQQRSILDAAHAMASQNRTDAEMGLAAPSMRGKQALLGDALANFQYKAPTHARANVVDFGSPYNLSDSTRQLGGLLSSGALKDQQQGNSPLEKVDFMSMLIDPPNQTALPKSGWLDKVLNTAGAVGSIGGAIGEATGAGGTTAGQIATNPYRTGRIPKVSFP